MKEFDDFIKRLIQVLESMDKPHRHMCGYDGDKFDPEQGCGHVWTHQLPPNCSSAEFKKEHTCPQCGKKEVTLKYFGATSP